MERLTRQQPDNNYTAAQNHNIEEIIDKLAKYENMYEALCTEQEKIVADMEKLRSSGKTKTVTFKQLQANKFMVMNIINRFDIYGL